ncbi:hypothetical protein OV203_45875 [Nannocystis sp. ILAH1]|uniref:hypothetical protein n=1 Tax=Nannocystis sp. ILAH1 TaxID=2996789 RepID=UPI00227095B6|nr:hypothetical protein [Nannocystis sp. ILAH1]MCY0994540.1 hypothetical protein [Nannocystis sp. ILAH1]
MDSPWPQTMSPQTQESSSQGGQSRTQASSSPAWQTESPQVSLQSWLQTAGFSWVAQTLSPQVPGWQSVGQRAGSSAGAQMPSPQPGPGKSRGQVSTVSPSSFWPLPQVSRQAETKVQFSWASHTSARGPSAVASLQTQSSGQETWFSSGSQTKLLLHCQGE